MDALRIVLLNQTMFVKANHQFVTNVGTERSSLARFVTPESKRDAWMTVRERRTGLIAQEETTLLPRIVQ